MQEDIVHDGTPFGLTAESGICLGTCLGTQPDSAVLAAYFTSGVSFTLLFLRSLF